LPTRACAPGPSIVPSGRLSAQRRRRRIASGGAVPDTRSRPCGCIGASATCSFWNPPYEGAVGGFSCLILVPDDFLRPWQPKRPCLPSGSFLFLFEGSIGGKEVRLLQYLKAGACATLSDGHTLGHSRHIMVYLGQSKRAIVRAFGSNQLLYKQAPVRTGLPVTGAGVLDGGWRGRALKLSNLSDWLEHLSRLICRRVRCPFCCDGVS
jgi:hypothetical protein